MNISPYLSLAALALLAATPRAAADPIPGFADLVRPVADLQQPAKPTGRGRNPSPATPAPGLRMSSLHPAAPQASGGLTSTARGLTAPDDWRRAFPAKK